MATESSQLTLFREQERKAKGQNKKVTSNHIPVRKSTFLAGTAVPIHSWFRLTPSFGPDLVRHTLDEMKTLPGSAVLDPFSGAGTAPIEAKLLGHNAIGFEINPLLHLVGNICLNWDLESAALSEDLKAIQSRFLARKKKFAGVPPDQLGLDLPQIHNVYRWWRPDVLADLLLLLDAIRTNASTMNHVQFFELAITGVLVPHLTNVTLGRLQLHFVNKDQHQMPVWETFEPHANRMIEDLASLKRIGNRGSGRVLLTDSTSPEGKHGLPKIDRVVTSPPYPNRYSYVWNTRPHLFFLGLINSGREAGDIDLKTIGGTWGTATSCLMKGVIEPKYPIIDRVIGPIATEIRKSDNLMANYLMKYFNMLADQIVVQDTLLKDDARLAYVVGCSRLKGVYVETDVLLGKVFEGLKLGYKLHKIERFRKRHSGKDLHESTVYVDKK